MCAAGLYSSQKGKAEGAALSTGGNGKLPAGATLLAAALNALSAHIAIIDARGVIVAVNDAWRSYADENGMRWPRYGVGYSYLSVLDNAAQADEGVGEIGRGVRRVLAGQADSYRAEYACAMPGGCYFVQQVTAFDHAGSRHAIISHENVTAQRLTEAELRAAQEAAENAQRAEAARRASVERRLRIAEAVADLLAIASSGRPIEDALRGMAGRVREVFSSQAAAIYSAEERWDRLVVAASCGTPRPAARKGRNALAPAILARALASPSGVGIDDAWQLERSPQEGDAPARLPDYRGLLVTPVQHKDQLYGYLVVFYAEPQAFVQDDLELVHLFAQQVTLALENAALRSHAERVAVANERNRLARELHDAVTQTLFSASIAAEALPRVWERNPAEGQRALEDLRLWTRGALAEMRTLLMELRPTALIEKPLPDLIRQLSEATAARLLIPVDCYMLTEVEPPAEVKLTLYRVVQEALNNIAKHAQASHIEIHYGARADGVQIRIVDDGCGFEPDTPTPGHMGLGIMRERAQHILATLDIQSASGAGTEVCIGWLPRGKQSSL